MPTAYRILQSAVFTNTSVKSEIVFILDDLPDWQTLAASAPQGSTVVLLDGSGDALAQMAEYLNTVSNASADASVDAIHLFSHGSTGSLKLGSVTLDSTNLTTYRETLAQIGSALGEEGDLL